MWSKETFCLNRISRNSPDPEMFMGGWDTLYLQSAIASPGSVRDEVRPKTLRSLQIDVRPHLTKASGPDKTKPQPFGTDDASRWRDPAAPTKKSRRSTPLRAPQRTSRAEIREGTETLATESISKCDSRSRTSPTSPSPRLRHATQAPLTNHCPLSRRLHHHVDHLQMRITISKAIDLLLLLLLLLLRQWLPRVAWPQSRADPF
jgi:hypothetical protein